MLDLIQLERKLDEVLKGETDKSLILWLAGKRELTVMTIKNYEIFNLNIPIAIVKAYTAEQAINEYCNDRNIYDRTFYKAVETASDIF